MEILILHLTYNELSQKTMFQSVPIAALCLYNIQRENLVFKNSLNIKKNCEQSQWKSKSNDLVHIIF